MLISILDIKYPPKESFVEGLLIRTLSNEMNVKQIIITARDDSYKKVHRKRQCIYLNILPQRKSIGRISGMVHLYFILRLIKKKYKQRTISLLVRNDPFYLLISVISINFGRDGTFLSSFPHEYSPVFVLKRFLARTIFLYVGKYIKRTITVSKIGEVRLARSGIRGKCLSVPMCVNRSDIVSLDYRDGIKSENNILKFIYIGTHINTRDLGLIFQVFIEAINNGLNLVLHTYGASEDEKKWIDENIIKNTYSGKICVHGTLNRKELFKVMGQYDVGISLIPPLYIYMESTPTKLAEYFSQGLPVIANSEIPFQKKVISESHAGKIVKYDKTEIYSGIKWLYDNMDQLPTMKTNAIKYVHEKLIYENYADSALKHMNRL